MPHLPAITSLANLSTDLEGFETGFLPNNISFTLFCTSVELYPAASNLLNLSCPFPHFPLITSLATSSTDFLEAGCEG